MSMKQLLKKVETARAGSPRLDREIAKIFPSAPANVSASIDAVTRLIEAELPGWWWTCGYCTLTNDASLYVPGSKSFPYAYAVMGPDSRAGPKSRALVNHPKWGECFDEGFHRDRRGGTVPLAMLAAFLEAKMKLMKVQSKS